MKMFRTFKQILNVPGDRDIMKKPILTIEVDCITQNNSSSQLCTTVSNATCVCYDCSELRNIHKRPHKFLNTVRTLRETGSCPIKT